MAIRKFPRQIFHDTLVLSVPSGYDRYQKPLTPTTYTINSVHVQADNHTKKTGDNTEVQLKGKVWLYPPYSSPWVDVETLQEQTQAKGGVMTCTITNKSGMPSGPYTVLTVNGYPDDFDNLHHIMMELC